MDVVNISSISSTLPASKDDIINFINDNEGIWSFIALVLLIAGIVVGWITGFFRKIWIWIKDAIRKRLASSIVLPRETLRIVPQPHRAYWNFGTQTIKKRKRRIILASCSFYVTNITRRGILITATYMKKPPSESVTPMVQEPPPNSHYWGRYPILSGHTSEMQTTYILDLSASRKGENLIGNIVIIDQLGNEHLVKGVKFTSR